VFALAVAPAAAIASKGNIIARHITDIKINNIWITMALPTLCLFIFSSFIFYIL